MIFYSYPQGKHGDRKSPDKPIMRPSRRNKPEATPGRNTPQKKKSGGLLKSPRDARMVEG